MPGDLAFDGGQPLSAWLVDRRHLVLAAHLIDVGDRAWNRRTRLSLKAGRCLKRWIGPGFHQARRVALVQLQSLDIAQATTARACAIAITRQRIPAHHRHGEFVEASVLQHLVLGSGFLPHQRHERQQFADLRAGNVIGVGLSHLNTVEPGVLARFLQRILRLDAQVLLAEPLRHLACRQLELAIEAVALAVGAIGDVVLARGEHLAANAGLRVFVDPDGTRAEHAHLQIGHVLAVVEVRPQQHVAHALGGLVQPALDRPELHSLLVLHHQVEPRARTRGEARHHAGGQSPTVLGRLVVDDLVVPPITLVDLLVTQQAGAHWLDEIGQLAPVRLPGRALILEHGEPLLSPLAQGVSHGHCPSRVLVEVGAA
ncbi:hypothetical protein D3C78_721720 [compost metagenome]